MRESEKGEHCFSIKISLKPAAIELSRCAIGSTEKTLLMRSQTNSIAFRLNSLKLSRMSLSLSLYHYRWRHPWKGRRIWNERRWKLRTQVCMLEQNKAIWYTCYTHSKMRTEEVLKFLFAFRFGSGSIVARNKRGTNPFACLLISFVCSSPSKANQNKMIRNHTVTKTNILP